MKQERPYRLLKNTFLVPFVMLIQLEKEKDRYIIFGERFEDRMQIGSMWFPCMGIRGVLSIFDNYRGVTEVTHKSNCANVTERCILS